MKLNIFLPIFITFMFMISCRSSEDQNAETPANSEVEAVPDGSFVNDVHFLQKWDKEVVVLSSDDGNAQVIVSPKYQGKVFTSTAEGDKGKSFGWINYDAFDKEVNDHMNAYGGEDRLWLGPEGGPFSLYFAPKTEMVFDNWHTPAPIDVEEWTLDSHTTTGIQLSKNMKLTNYAGTVLSINIDRNISLLTNNAIADMLGVSLGDGVNVVGFKTTNVLKNTGNNTWDEQTGAPCMWNLDMFTPSPETVIVIPYQPDVSGKIATTDYFGEIPADRIKMDNGVLYFKADGKSRGKLGIPPLRVKPVGGSYAADEGVLTIIQFDVVKNGTYLNQEWTTKKDPFTGDVMNAYNDGPLEDGTQMGPFYEIESVSPAAFLNPNETQTHVHSVFHFTGDKSSLDVIAQKVLGTSLDAIAGTFK